MCYLLLVWMLIDEVGVPQLKDTISVPYCRKCLRVKTFVNLAVFGLSTKVKFSP